MFTEFNDRRHYLKKIDISLAFFLSHQEKKKKDVVQEQWQVERQVKGWFFSKTLLSHLS